jgi:thiamine-monophosphate kinase
MVDEFDLIAQYFRPLAAAEGLHLLDDAACISAKVGYDLVLSKDILVSDIHFFRDDDPYDIALKALAVNLSDIAAKGAFPKYYMLGLSLPHGVSPDWLSAFSKGLKHGQAAVGMHLIGGDTTKSPRDIITISITIFGEIEHGKMIERSGAKIGDDIYVTGELGLAAFGLLVWQGQISVNDDSLLHRYLRPAARSELGPALVGTATASADVSDGLLADVAHICTASNKGAEIFVDQLPTTESVRALCDTLPQYRSFLWSGGDDYEIVFTADRSARQKISDLSNDFNTLITKVGHITNEKSVLIYNENRELIKKPETGYRHF